MLAYIRRKPAKALLTMLLVTLLSSMIMIFPRQEATPPTPLRIRRRLNEGLAFALVCIPGGVVAAVLGIVTSPIWGPIWGVFELNEAFKNKRTETRKAWSKEGWDLNDGDYLEFRKIPEDERIMATIINDSFFNDKVKIDLPGSNSHVFGGARSPTIPEGAVVQVLCKKNEKLYSPERWGMSWMDKMTVYWPSGGKIGNVKVCNLKFRHPSDKGRINKHLALPDRPKPSVLGRLLIKASEDEE